MNLENGKRVASEAAMKSQPQLKKAAKKEGKGKTNMLENQHKQVSHQSGGATGRKFF